MNFGMIHDIFCHFSYVFFWRPRFIQSWFSPLVACRFPEFHRAHNQGVRFTSKFSCFLRTLQSRPSFIAWNRDGTKSHCVMNKQRSLGTQIAMTCYISSCLETLFIGDLIRRFGLWPPGVALAFIQHKKRRKFEFFEFFLVKCATFYEIMIKCCRHNVTELLERIELYC